MSRVMVITPTTGKDTVFKAIQSVKEQTMTTEHLVVLDGVQKTDGYIPKDLLRVIHSENFIKYQYCVITIFENNFQMLPLLTFFISTKGL